MRYLILACLAIPTSAQTDELPFADYFVGDYELVARLPGSQGDSISDRLTITVTGDEFPLHLAACKLGNGSLGPEAADHEGAWALTGQLGSLELTCDQMNNGDNYPVLNCYLFQDGQYGFMTLWPSIQDDVPAAQRECS